MKTTEIESVEVREERINIIALLSDITCGEACWHARELICKCSCGGKNHGCLKGKDGEMPLRTCKLEGVMYELASVGEYGDLCRQANEINKQFPRKPVPYPCESGFITYSWQVTDYNAPARVKPCSKSQLEHWQELSEQKNWPMYRKAYCMWKRLSKDNIKIG